MKNKRINKDAIDFSSFPKWGTPEADKAEAVFFQKNRGWEVPAMPIISDAEFYRLQNLSAKYRTA